MAASHSPAHHNDHTAIAASVPAIDAALTSSAEQHASPQVINNDCYMVVASDTDASAVLDLDSFVLDDVMMTDEHDDQLLIWVESARLKLKAENNIYKVPIASFDSEALDHLTCPRTEYAMVGRCCG